MDGIKAIFGSKKAVIGLVLTLASVVFVAIGKMTIEQWKEFALWLYGTWATAETVNGVTATVVNRNRPEPVVVPANQGSEPAPDARQE